MLRKVGVLVGLVVFAGSLLAAGPKDKKVSKPVMGKIVKADAAKGMITVKTKDGTMEDLMVGEDTKIKDSTGKDVTDGLKDKRMAAGADISVMLGSDGKTVKEIHLAGAKGSPNRAAQGGRRRTIDPIEKPDAPPPATPGAEPPPNLATVLSVDEGKKAIVLTIIDAKGKSEERSIDVKEGVKLIGGEGAEGDLKAFRKGDTVVLVEQEGKVTELRVFKLGAKKGSLKDIPRPKK